MARNQKIISSEKNIAEFVSDEGCFDLQFRRDVRRKRTGNPTYYCWKAQFALLGGYDKEKTFRQIKSALNCGNIHFVGENQVRYSVQSIDELHNLIVPFFQKHFLFGNKKNDFELWGEAVGIIFQNKRKNKYAQKGVRGFARTKWNKKDFLHLINIEKAMQKYKVKRSQSLKWLPIAEEIAKILK